MPALEITLFGGFRARLSPGDVVPLATRKFQALLAYLALSPGQEHPRDKLAALLWGDMRQKQARANLRQALLALRRALDHTGALRIEGETVALDASVVSVDARRFEEGVAGPPEALTAALALYQGDLLAGLTLQEAPFEEWLLAERERLRELALEAAARLLAHQRRQGETEGAIQTALKLLALDPLQEPVHRTLMRLYVEAGRRGTALRQYQTCVEVLQRELRTEPELETKRLYQDILREQAARTMEEPAPDRGIVAAESRLAMASRETALVGRDAEMTRLGQILEAARGGRGTTVAVIGEAGIGKSRLVAEVLQTAGHGVTVLLGRCYASEQILPFGPWIDALRAARLTDDPALLTLLAPVWRAELARLLPELGPSPGRTEMGYRGLFEAIVQVLAHLARRRPLLVVLEDVHCADEMSTRLLAFVGRRVPDWPALLVATARADELVDAPGLPAVLAELEHDGLVRVNLRPLSREDTGLLVRSVAPTGVSPRVRDTLEQHAWVASEGNPFVVVETVRAHADGVWGGNGGSLGLPDRVREIVRRRLDRLSERARSLASAAAVIGREFDFALLQRAAGLGEVEAAEGVEELVRRGLLREVGGGRLDFAHQFIRDVAGGGILPVLRGLLHGRVSAALEDVYAANLQPHYSALARHHHEAGRWDRAAHYFHLAGRHAFAVGAAREAANALRSALEAIERQQPAVKPGERLDTWVDLWAALFELGEFEELQQLAERVEALARSLDDRPRLAQILVRRAQARWVRLGFEPGPLEEALGQAREATALADSDDLRTRSYGQFLVGTTCRDLGRFADALAELERGIRLFDPAGTPDDTSGLSRPILVSLHAWRAETLATLGNLVGAANSARTACTAAEAIDHPASLALAAAFAGYVEILRGDVASARSHLERGLALAEQHEQVHALGFNQVFLAWALVLAGERPQGLALLARAEEAPERLRDLGLQYTRYRTVSASVRLAAGRLDEAKTDAAQGLAIAIGSGALGHRATLLRLLSEISEHDQALDEAAALAEAALADATGHELRPEIARCHLVLGRLARHASKREEAREHFVKAVGLMQEMQLGSWLAAARAEAASTH